MTAGSRRSSAVTPPAVGGLRQYSSNRLLSVRGMRPFSAPVDLGVLRTGYLEKINIGPLLLTRAPQKRYVVLTERRLHWYRRSNQSDLFGDQVGSVAVREISKVIATDEVSFEVITSERRRVFRAGDMDERDMWISAILEVLKEVAHVDSSGTAEGIEAAPTLMSEEESLIDAVSHKAHGVEVVLSRCTSYGTTITLDKLSQADMVVVWLRSGAHADVEGAEVARVMNKGPIKVVLSDGRGTVCVSFQRGTPKPQPTSLGQYGRTMRATVAALLVTMVLRQVPTLGVGSPVVWLCLLVLLDVCYGLTWRRKTADPASLGQVHMTITEFEAKVDDLAMRRAAALAIPPKFVAGCLGDMMEARRRWDITRKWREEYEIDQLLDRPHPHFLTIKKVWPHYFLPRGRDGSWVLLDHIGDCLLPKFMELGVTMDDVVHHIVYLNEYVSRKMLDDPDRDALIQIYDLSTACLSNLKGEAKTLMKRALYFLQQHYAERSKAVLLINAPSWMTVLLRIIRPLLNEVTQRKIRMAPAGAETYKVLLEFMAPENIPVEYGGKLRPREVGNGVRFYSSAEQQFYDYVAGVNARFPQATKPPRVYEGR